MIKINKKPAPIILSEHQATWTKELTDAVVDYGGYDKIPSNIKDSLLAHYRHKGIQITLAQSSFYKCAFCECKPGESGNIEVEHFEPKSLYPEGTYDWDNLLPSCRKCNEAKRDYDTRTIPIINPAKEDPEALLTYCLLDICPVEGTVDETKARNTIEVCNLNSPRLHRARADLMISISQYIGELKEKLVWISEADTPQKRAIRITKLSNSLEKIDLLFEPSGLYSGYCKWLVTQYKEYREAKEIVMNRPNAVVSLASNDQSAYNF